jgi:uncharacterized protein
MNKMYLIIREVEGKGRGVFTSKAFRKGELLEVCPVLVFNPVERELLDQTLLYNYMFIWGDDDAQSALALGYGSMYNHSSTPNVRYLADYETGTLEIHAYRDIAAGEELCFNYNGDPEDKDLVWFEK